MSFNYDEIEKILRNGLDDVLYYYDRKTDQVVHLELKDDSCNQDYLYRSENDKRNFIRLPFVDTTTLYLKYVYERVNDEPMRKYLYDAGGKKSQINRIEKFGLTEDYLEFLKESYRKIILHWANVHELITEDASDSEFKEILNLGMELKDKAPWRYFQDMDYFKIRYMDDDIYYVILGYQGECFGVEMFYNDEGYKDLLLETTLASMDPSSIYPMVARNSLTVYFDPYDALVPEEQDMVDHMNQDIEENLYPSFMVTHTSHMPRQVKTVSECYKYKKGLTALNMFMDEFLKKPKEMDDENYVHLVVFIDGGTGKVSYRQNNRAFREDIFPYEMPLLTDEEIVELRKGLSVEDGLAYLDIKAIPVGDGNNLEPYFLMVLYDCKKEKLIGTEPYHAIDDDYILGMIHGFSKDMKEKRMPSRIMVRNPLVAILINILYGDKVKTEFQMDPFEPIEEFTMGLFDSFTDEHTATPDDSYVS